MVRPSTTISRRLPPSMSRFLTMTFVDTTSFSAHLCSCPLQCKSPCSQDPRLRARCSMVATAVEETATSAGAGREGKRKVQTAAQQHAERLRVDTSRPRRRECHQDVAGSVKLGQTTRATLCSCIARAAGFCHPCFGSTGFSSSSFCPGRRIHARPRNLVLGGGTGVSPLLLPRPGAFASRSGCSQPNWPGAQPLHCLMPDTNPVLPNSLASCPSRVLNLRRCPPNGRSTSTPRRHGLGRTPQTSEVSPSGGGNWLEELRNTTTRATHSEDPALPVFSETEKHVQLPWRATESSQTRHCQSGSLEL